MIKSTNHIESEWFLLIQWEHIINVILDSTTMKRIWISNHMISTNHFIISLFFMEYLESDVVSFLLRQCVLEMEHLWLNIASWSAPWEFPGIVWWLAGHSALQVLLIWCHPNVENRVPIPQLHFSLGNLYSSWGPSLLKLSEMT